MAVGLGLLAGVSWWLGRVFPTAATSSAIPAAGAETKTEGPTPALAGAGPAVAPSAGSGGPWLFWC